MSERIVKLPNGREYEVCGMPIGQSEEQLRQVFPALMDALASANIHNLAYEILKLNHPDLKKDGFWVDQYAYEKIEAIFFGSAYDTLKKKTGEP